MARRRKDSFTVARRRGGWGTPRTRRVVTWVVAVLAALLILGGIGFFQLVSYLQGEKFRHELEDKLRNRAQAESVTLGGNLALSGSHVSLSGVEARRKGLLHGLRVSHIQAEMDRGALLDRVLHLTKLSAEDAELVLDIDHMNETLPPVEEEEKTFWSRFAPDTLQLDAVSCKSLDTTLHVAGGDYSLTSCSLSAKPAARQGGWEFQIENGRLYTPLSYLKDSGLKSATIRVSDKGFSLSQGRLMLSPGELIVNAAYASRGKRWSADMRVNKADLARLLTEDWKQRLSGRLFGKLELRGGADGLTGASGSISVQEGEVEALPILSELSIDGTRPYRTFKLEKATCRVTYPFTDASRNIRNAWCFDQIDVRAAEGILLVRGHVIVDSDGALGGTLRIGLPERFVARLALPGGGLLDSIFSAKGGDGYFWINLNLSGTTDSPQEDLSVRLSTLLKQALAEPVATAKDKVTSTAESLGSMLNGLFSRSGAKDDESAETPQEEESEEAKPAATEDASKAKKPESEPLEINPGRIIKGAGDAAQEALDGGMRLLF